MKAHVLLIDDDRDELDIFVSAMNRTDIPYECTYYDDVEEALKMLGNIHPDLIFVDLNMPRISGIECLRLIREKDDFSHTPLILYSTGIDENYYQRAMMLGASACINKTSDLSSLSVQLKKIIA